MNCICILSATGKVIQKVSLQTELRQIYEAITEIYQDISNAAFESAVQSFESIHEGLSLHDIYLKIEITINNLMNAYNVLSILIEKKKSYGFWVFKTSDYVINTPMDRYNVYKNIAVLAKIISMLYNYMADESNSTIWKNKTISMFLEMLKYDSQFEREYLMTLSNNYVEEYHWQEEIPTDDYGRRIISGVSYELTEEGKEYIKQTKSKLLNDFINAINKTDKDNVKILIGGKVLNVPQNNNY